MNALSDRASPMAKAVSTPTTTAALRCSAVRTDARTLTCTTTTAVRVASTAAETSTNFTASPHARPPANAAFATVPTSVDVGGVHDTASATRSHPRRRRLVRRRGGSGFTTPR